MARCLFVLQAPPKMSVGPMKGTKLNIKPMNLKHQNKKASQGTTVISNLLNLKHQNKKASQTSNKFKAGPLLLKIEVRDPCIRRLKTKLNCFCLIRSFAEKILGLDC